MDQIDVGKRIKYLRINKLKMSQEDFALKVGIDRTYLCKIESGKKNLTLETINKMCDGLEMTIQEFFNTKIDEMEN